MTANWIPTYGCAFSLADVPLPLKITNIYGQDGNSNPSFKPVIRPTSNKSDRIVYFNVMALLLTVSSVSNLMLLW